jgi:hypothetical protein
MDPRGERFKEEWGQKGFKDRDRIPKKEHTFIRREEPKGRIVKLRRINTPLLFVGKKTWGVKLKKGSHTATHIG